MNQLLTLPDSFGPALRFLRKRARLTQDELGRAVGYSREQIARLENGSRLPDLAVIAALFVPALLLERDRALVEQFLALAGQTRRERQITITHTKQTRIQLVQETVTTTAPGHIPPAPLLPLLGRQAEVAELVNRLQTARLITLVGAPGIGKTRLALAVAHAALGQFADGAAFVSLAEATTLDDIPYVVLRQLDISPTPQQTAVAAIQSYLAPRHLLLVLDNCEHLLEGVTLFSDWLTHAPCLTLLCTSRTPLDLYGEQEWPLAPLPVPDLAQRPSPDWAHTAAMQLLLARAQAIDPTFALSDVNLLPLATLCAALDGLPLALELAAARLRDHEPANLVQQLLMLRGNNQLASTWLQQTRRNVAERHRTLHAAIAWSVHLLPAAAQHAFYRLGVFVGGGAAAAAEAIAQANAAPLAQLARVNLVGVRDGRFYLLETLRAFALEQLTAADQLAATLQAHAHYYAQFTQEVFAGLLGEEQGVWMPRALADQDNFLAALRWALAAGDGETAVAIAGNLWWFWYRRSLFALGRELLTAALQLPSTDLSQRARALNGLASFCLELGDYAANLTYHEEGLALRRQLGDRLGISTALHNLGLTAVIMGEYDLATARLMESIEVYPEGDHASELAHLGLIAQETLDLPTARRYLQQAYDQAKRAGDGWSKAFVGNYLADVLRELGELAAAEQLALESLRIFSELEDSHFLPDAQLTLAQLAMNRGEYETAVSLAALAYAHYAAREDAIMMASALLVQAELAWERDDAKETAALLARARALRQTEKRAMSPHEQVQYMILAEKLGVAG
ncbi:MAG: tetratricopeptide repeat protein [Candidatus Promineifilaceae bacterium]